MENNAPQVIDPNQNPTPTDTPPPVEPTPSVLPPVTPSDPPAANVIEPQGQKPKRSHKKLIVLLVLTLLLVAGTAAWWFLVGSKNSNNSSATNNTPAQTTDTDKTNTALTPANVAYAFGDASNRDVDLFLRPIAGGERSSAGKIPQNNHVSESGVYKNKVFFVTSPSKADGKLAISYSSDGGKTYATVFEGAASSNETVGDQITSARFSTDGSRIVFGFLAQGSTAAQVKELDPETKQTNDLFSVENAGVFIHGYDAAKAYIIYSTGCFNCDGNMMNKVYAQDVKANKETELYDTPDKIGMRITANSDLTKLLVVQGTPGDGLGGGAPYAIDEYDIVDKTFKTLATSAQAYVSASGYGENGLPYYAAGKTVKQIAKDGKETVLFEGAKDVYDVLLVDDEQVVVAVGDVSDFELAHFAIESKTLTNILSGDNVTYLFGVTWK